MTRKLLATLLILLNITILAAQNGTKEISLEQVIKGSFNQISGTTQMRSSADGNHYTAMNQEHNMIVSYEYKTGNIVDTLFNVLSTKGCEFNDFEDYSISPDGSIIMIYRDSEPIYRRSSRLAAYIYNTDSNTIEPLSKDKEKVMIPTLSPDCSKCAYVFNNNIYLRYLGSDKEIQITNDGLKNHIINGASDWVYEEEFSITNLMSWSPDSKTLSWLRFDESQVKEYSMTMYGEGTYPSEYKFKYPKVGEKNSEVSLKSYNTQTGVTSNLEITDPNLEYITKITYSGDGNNLAVFTLNRLQDCFRLYYIDTDTNTTKLVYEDTNHRYIDSEWFHSLTFTGKGFLYVSERDGYAHIYEHDHNGQLIRQVTSGNQDVTDLIGYDPKDEVIYYESVDNSPTQRAVYSINKKGKKQKLTTKTGTNSVRFSSNFAYYTSYFNSATEPMNIAVIETKSGKNLRTLVDNKQLIDSLAEYRFSHKEFFTVTTKSNQTLNAWIVKPADFDSTKSYPMLMIQYSGPHSQMATDSFSIGWEQYLATQGIITVCVDGRGTAARGEEFRKCTYLTMGLLESQDQIEAAQALSELPYIDADRMAIWGWSFGGYNTLLALSRGEGTFKVGIAVAPVTDWRYYDTIYTERFMRTNKENQHGYDISSPIMLTDDLEGKLLLIHGTADDNVHFKQSLDYAEKLVQAGKQFDMFVYRDRNHSIFGGNTRQHLYRKMADYLKENL